MLPLSKLLEISNASTRVFLARNGSVETTFGLLNDKRLSKYVNPHTMGVLANYAKHENMNICILPLKNDLFDDLAVHVTPHAKGAPAPFSFAVKLEEGREGLNKFLKDLYTTIHNKSHINDEASQVSRQNHRFTALENFANHVKLIKNNTIRDFVNNNSGKKGVKGLLADALEEIYDDIL